MINIYKLKKYKYKILLKKYKLISEFYTFLYKIKIIN